MMKMATKRLPLVVVSPKVQLLASVLALLFALSLSPSLPSFFYLGTASESSSLHPRLTRLATTFQGPCPIPGDPTPPLIMVPYLKNEVASPLS